MGGEPLFEPVVLSGRAVRLEPLTPEHLPALTAAGSDPAIFRYYPVDFSGAAGMKVFFDDAFRTRDLGSALPFAVIAGGEPVGSTRFGNIERKHRRAEIGWTWLAPRVQRTAVNTEMKYLMLNHAFETSRLMRIEFKTDSLNEPSRRALLRIGAVEEGTFRNHMISQHGRIRHSVYFSITDQDWPSVKARLQQKLAQDYSGRSRAA
jgi:RimJ/RimL family protein N-acetyltransferase